MTAFNTSNSLSYSLSDTSSYNNFGPMLDFKKARPRCGHCGRFIGASLDVFDAHLENDCPVGGIFVGGNRLKVNGEYRQRAP